MHRTINGHRSVWAAMFTLINYGQDSSSLRPRHSTGRDVCLYHTGAQMSELLQRLSGAEAEQGRQAILGYSFPVNK